MIDPFDMPSFSKPLKLNLFCFEENLSTEFDDTTIRFIFQAGFKKFP